MNQLSPYLDEIISHALPSKTKETSEERIITEVLEHLHDLIEKKSSLEKFPFNMRIFMRDIYSDYTQNPIFQRN